MTESVAEESVRTVANVSDSNEVIALRLEVEQLRSHLSRENQNIWSNQDDLRAHEEHEAKCDPRAAGVVDRDQAFLLEQDDTRLEIWCGKKYCPEGQECDTQLRISDVKNSDSDQQFALGAARKVKNSDSDQQFALAAAREELLWSRKLLESTLKQLDRFKAQEPPRDSDKKRDRSDVAASFLVQSESYKSEAAAAHDAEIFDDEEKELSPNKQTSDRSRYDSDEEGAL